MLMPVGLAMIVLASWGRFMDKRGRDWFWLVGWIVFFVGAYKPTMEVVTYFVALMGQLLAPGRMPLLLSG